MNTEEPLCQIAFVSLTSERMLRVSRNRPQKRFVLSKLDPIFAGLKFRPLVLSHLLLHVFTPCGQIERYVPKRARRIWCLSTFSGFVPLFHTSKWSKRNWNIHLNIGQQSGATIVWPTAFFQLLYVFRSGSNTISGHLVPKIFGDQHTKRKHKNIFYSSFADLHLRTWKVKVKTYQPSKDRELKYANSNNADDNDVNLDSDKSIDTCCVFQISFFPIEQVPRKSKLAFLPGPFPRCFLVGKRPKYCIPTCLQAMTTRVISCMFQLILEWSTISNETIHLSFFHLTRPSASLLSSSSHSLSHVVQCSENAQENWISPINSVSQVFWILDTGKWGRGR